MPNTLEWIIFENRNLWKIECRPPSDFAVFDGYYFLCYCSKKLKTSQIAQINQLFYSYANEQKCKQ